VFHSVEGSVKSGGMLITKYFTSGFFCGVFHLVVVYGPFLLPLFGGFEPKGAFLDWLRLLFASVCHWVFLRLLVFSPDKTSKRCSVIGQKAFRIRLVELYLHCMSDLCKVLRSVL